MLLPGCAKHSLVLGHTQRNSVVTWLCQTFSHTGPYTEEWCYYLVVPNILSYWAIHRGMVLLPGCAKHSLVLGHTQRNGVVTWLCQTFSRTEPYTEEWCCYLVVPNILSYWAIHRGMVLLPGCAKHSLILGHTQRNGVITWLCQTFSRTEPYTEEWCCYLVVPNILSYWAIHRGMVLLPGCAKHSLILGHTQRNGVITWLCQTFSHTGPYTEEWCYYLVVPNILSYWAIHRGMVLLPGCAKHSLVLGHTQRNSVITWLCQIFSRTGPYTEEWCYYLVVPNILSYWAIHRGMVLLPGCAKHSLILGHTQRNGVITWLCQTFSRTGPYTEE